MRLLRWGAGADALRRKAFLAIERCPRFLRLITGGQQRSGLRRGLMRVSDHHGDRLARVPHVIVLQQIQLEHDRAEFGIRVRCQRWLVRGRHDVDHAGMGAGRGLIQRQHPATRYRADGQRRVHHARRMIIGREHRFPRRLQHAVAPGDGLAHAGPHTQVGGVLGQLQIRRFEISHGS